MCVSGLPHRNGDEHGRVIVLMSIEIMNSIKKLRIPHLPDERISLRIGMHTGPCVAGQALLVYRCRDIVYSVILLILEVVWKAPDRVYISDITSAYYSKWIRKRVKCFIVNTFCRYAQFSSVSAGRIHLSSEMNHFLTIKIGGFKTESRGEILVKGKEVLETFWLIGQK
ncbi:unnamed protein product [Anisakis simplex]|uniref:Guanylate cyclase domain-containing protein n=1 Tax=Anisakis simplex TaxID=6269 RepID=A0A3P6RJ39_ANISI|nr:unnamed protein product [Anisakis simplex]